MYSKMAYFLSLLGYTEEIWCSSFNLLCIFKSIDYEFTRSIYFDMLHIAFACFQVFGAYRNIVPKPKTEQREFLDEKCSRYESYFWIVWYLANTMSAIENIFDIKTYLDQIFMIST